MFCYKCGQQVVEEWNYCRFCGTPVRHLCSSAQESERQMIKAEIERLREEIKLRKEEQKLKQIRLEKEKTIQKQQMSPYVVIVHRFSGTELLDLGGPYDSYEDAIWDLEIYRSHWEVNLDEDESIEIVYK